MTGGPFAAEFEPARGDPRRRALRAPVALDAAVEHDGLDRAVCRVSDLSRFGARLSAYVEFTAGARIWLTLPGQRPRVARVRWAAGFEAGCEFVEPLSAALCRELGGDPD